MKILSTVRFIGGYDYIVVNKKDMKVVNLYETAAYKQRAGLVRKWYTEGYIRKDIAVSEKNFQQDAKAQKYALFTGGNLTPGVEASMKGTYGYDVVYR